MSLHCQIFFNLFYLHLATTTKKISFCTLLLLFSRWFSILRKWKTSTRKQREKNNWVHRALQRAAFGCLRKVSSKAPPAAWEASSLAALALSCLNWILADSASSVPSSGRTRWIGMSPRRRRKTLRSRSRAVADAPEPVTEAGRLSSVAMEEPTLGGR